MVTVQRGSGSGVDISGVEVGVAVIKGVNVFEEVEKLDEVPDEEALLADMDVIAESLAEEVDVTEILLDDDTVAGKKKTTTVVQPSSWTNARRCFCLGGGTAGKPVIPYIVAVVVTVHVGSSTTPPGT